MKICVGKRNILAISGIRRLICATLNIVATCVLLEIHLSLLVEFLILEIPSAVRIRTTVILPRMYSRNLIRLFCFVQ